MAKTYCNSLNFNGQFPSHRRYWMLARPYHQEARKRMRVAHESAKVHEAAKARGARTVSAQTATGMH